MRYFIWEAMFEGPNIKSVECDTFEEAVKFFGLEDSFAYENPDYSYEQALCQARAGAPSSFHIGDDCVSWDKTPENVAKELVEWASQNGDVDENIEFFVREYSEGGSLTMPSDVFAHVMELLHQK